MPAEPTVAKKTYICYPAVGMKLPSSRILSALFFASGAAGLMYEVVWVRMLVLVFGNTTHSIVAVVSAFLGGLAIGSLLAGRFTERNNGSSLLRTYAYLEGSVAITAVVVTLILPLVVPLYARLTSGSDITLGILLFKFCSSVGLLLIPTILMGATLPVLVQFFQSHYPNTLDRTVGKLYAVNTLGAVCGVALTGFVLLELVGLRGTIAVAASVNLLIALFVYGFLEERSSAPAAPASIPSMNTAPYRTILILACMCFSGLLAIAYQILWTRILTPTTGTFVYAFSIILILYLLGIAAGSFLYTAALGRLGSRNFVFSLSHLGIGLFAMGSVYLTSIHAPISTVWLVLGVILPATLCMGVSFPAGIALLRDQGGAGMIVGTAYFSNTLGSIIGGVLAGFVLIPMLGSSPSIVFLSLGNFLLALVVMFGTLRTSPRTIAVAYSSAVLLVFAFDGWVFAEKRPFLLESSTRARMQAAEDGGYPYRFVEDEVASVFAYDNPTTGEQNLFVDGVPITNIGPETRLMAHLPIALHPHPKNMAVIAFGMGSTFRSAMLHPISVDAIELSKAVVGMFPLFFRDATAIQYDSRGTIIINDGRNHVLLTDTNYDVITIDPPPPFNAAGTTILYSKDFYKQLSGALNDGGIVSQWVYFGSREDDTAMVIKSFVDVFPYVLVFRSPGGVAGIYLIGSYDRLAINQARMRAVFGSASVKNDLKEVGSVINPRDIPGMMVGDGSDMRRFATGYPAVTDNRPRTEYFLLRHWFRSSPPMTMDLLDFARP
jgi:spermidine synthase